jgi:vacuolar-type H+-ATPase subunit F/Vma7
MSTSKNVRVVCRPPQAPGFRLAGLEADLATDAAQAALALKHHCADAKVGVVLIDEQLHAALPLELRARLEKLAQPIIAPFPAPTWDETAAAEAYVLEILRQAVGYRVRPR